MSNNDLVSKSEEDASLFCFNGGFATAGEESNHDSSLSMISGVTQSRAISALYEGDLRQPFGRGGNIG